MEGPVQGKRNRGREVKVKQRGEKKRRRKRCRAGSIATMIIGGGN